MNRKMAVAVMMLGVSAMGARAVTIVDYTGSGSMLESRAADTVGAAGAWWKFSDTVSLIEGILDGGSNTRIYGGLSTNLPGNIHLPPAALSSLVLQIQSARQPVAVREHYGQTDLSATPASGGFSVGIPAFTYGAFVEVTY